MTRALPVPTEKETQHDVVKLFRGAGCHVYSLSQYRRSKVALGLPDLFVFCPRRETAWWWESKRPGEKLRPKQQEFRDRCAETRSPHYWGGVPEAIALLRHLQLVATPKAEDAA